MTEDKYLSFYHDAQGKLNCGCSKEPNYKSVYLSKDADIRYTVAMDSMIQPGPGSKKLQRLGQFRQLCTLPVWGPWLA